MDSRLGDRVERPQAVIRRLLIASALGAMAVFGATSAPAFWNSRLKVYACPSEQSAISCDSSCNATGREMEVKVNVSNKSIIVDFYGAGQLLSSNSPNGPCSLVDEKNWVCGPSSNFRGSPINSMSRGRYSYYHTERSSSYPFVGACGK